MKKDTVFYNATSGNYSAVRYPARTDTFTQFFFKERLALLLDIVRAWTQGRSNLSLLELGCADGVVVRAIHDVLPNTFSTIDAADISPGMISAAQKLHACTPIHFCMRSELPKRTYDLVLEVGVLNYTPFDADLDDLCAFVSPGGAAVVSIAGSKYAQKGDTPHGGYLHFYLYSEYEAKIKQRFLIAAAKPVGFVVPGLWRVPMLGRMLQPVLEKAFTFQSDLYHEKLYLLTPETSTR